MFVKNPGDDRRSRRRPVMASICWSLIHQAVAPVAHDGNRLFRIARHPVQPAVHGAGQAVPHAPTLAVRPHQWIELVCKVIPAVVGGGGLLIPHPTEPPMLPEAPPAISDPGPAFLPWSSPMWIVSPDLPVEADAGAAPAPEATLEPSSADILLPSVSGLVLVRLIMRRSTHSSAGA
jgi:hypothetical protein